MTPNPFIHLPQLRDRLTPADVSELRMTPERLAIWDARAREAGQDPQWRLADDAREAMRCATLGGRSAPGDLWVYAYGSLMWDPAIHFSEVRLACVDNYQRRFSYRITGGRGSPQCPALMLTLAPEAGTCDGLVFRIPAEHVDAETTILWRREMVRGGYAPAWRTVSTPQGPVEALVFAANCAHPEYVGDLTLDETAAVVATACGPLGSNRAYLESLAAQLTELQIEDQYIVQLLAMVSALDAA
ncbi:MAG: gamma-glutamylcyclotransferase [Burkholderiaceae bacterium]